MLGNVVQDRGCGALQDGPDGGAPQAGGDNCMGKGQFGNVWKI